MTLISRLESGLIKRHAIKNPQIRIRDLLDTVSKESLLFYYANFHSQTGQDGILAEIFRRISISKGTFVEFGAWDGLYLSNTRWLYEKGWDGVFIEGDDKKYAELTSLYKNTNTRCLHAMVGASKNNCLSETLRNVVDTDDINLVSIDVDGMDLDIFESMGFKPDVVVLEGGFNFSPFLNAAIPDSVAHLNLQQPLYQINEIARKMDYSIVCFYQDSYLIRNDHIHKFPSFDIVTLYRDAFYFMPEHFRRWLIDFRCNNRDIQKVELDYFNKFDANPLKYGFDL